MDPKIAICQLLDPDPGSASRVAELRFTHFFNSYGICSPYTLAEFFNLKIAICQLLDPDLGSVWDSTYKIAAIWGRGGGHFRKKVCFWPFTKVARNRQKGAKTEFRGPKMPPNRHKLNIIDVVVCMEHLFKLFWTIKICPGCHGGVRKGQNLTQDMTHEKEKTMQNC